MTPPPFQTLLDAHAAEVLGLLRALVGPQEAEDCFQETVVAALRAYPPRHDGNLRAWLLTIARNAATDSHRARSRAPLPVEEVPEQPAAADRAPTADDELWAAVRALPERQRLAIALRYACDLAHKDVAAQLGCSEEAARRSAHEGLKRLKEVLAA